MMDLSFSTESEAFARLAAANMESGAPPSSATFETAFVLLLPELVRSARVGEISKRLRVRGLRLSAMKMLRLGGRLATAHYTPRCSSSDVEEFVTTITPGVVIAMLWSGDSAHMAVASLGRECADSLIEVAPNVVESARLASLWFKQANLEAAVSVLLNAPAVAPAVSRGDVARPSDCFYITTAINYANGPPHMGHAYEGIVADVIARYHRAFGREVFFLTGADEHGQKIADTAAAQGLAPIQLVNRCVAQFQALNKQLGVSPNRYVRTSSEAHKATAQHIWRVAQERGDVYLDMYVGWYNVREETFVTETEAQATNYKDPLSGKLLQKMEEPSYFFRLSKYQQKIRDHIAAHPEFVQPAKRRNDVLSRLSEPLVDLSVSRTTFEWGVPVPADPRHVMYVWFDALTNYLTGIDYPLGARTTQFWPADVHVIGKDIAWFHCVIWPALLLSVGVSLPRTVLAHGFVHGADGRKMSKSIGNVVNAYDVLQRHSVDSFRYFCIRDVPFGGDLTFSEDALALRSNAELADTFGNLVHRALTLCAKYAKGCVPDARAEAIFDVGKLRESTEDAYASFTLHSAMELVIEALFAANKYVTDAAPWHMTDDDPRRLVIVRTLLEAIYASTHFMQPVLVEAASNVFNKLGTPPVPIAQLRITFDNLTPGTGTAAGELLFEKVATAEMLARMEAEAAAKKAAAMKKTVNTTLTSGATELSKLDLRVGKVLSVEKHPDADALYVEQIDLGEAKPRQVVSGLVKYLCVEDLLGQRVVVLANIKVSKMRGVESQAMLLCAAAADGSAMELLMPPEGCTLGERIVFEGHDFAPEPVLNPKKKVWEKLQLELNTSAEHVACYRELPFTTAHGPCKAATLASAMIK